MCVVDGEDVVTWPKQGMQLKTEKRKKTIKNNLLPNSILVT